MQALDRWENRLEALFEGRPYDALDAALTDTVARFPVHIQPFRHALLRHGLLMACCASCTQLLPHAARSDWMWMHCRRDMIGGMRMDLVKSR